MANISNWTILKPETGVIANSTVSQNSTHIGTTHAGVAPFLYLGTIFTFSLVSNGKLVYTVAANQAMRSRVNILLAFMAISDLMVTCINMPLAAYKLFSRSWKIGRLACIFNVAVFQVFDNMKIFMLFFVLSDRYHAAFHQHIFISLEIKPSPWIIALFSMALATLLAIPLPLLSIIDTNYDIFGLCICYHKATNDIGVYLMAIISITICSVLVIVLIKILNACRKQRLLVSQDSTKMPSRVHKKDTFGESYRVTKSNFVILLGLAFMQCVCVIPLEIAQVYIFISRKVPSNQLYIAMLWLLYSSTIVNPIACYCQKIRILDKGFRSRRILRFMPLTRNQQRKRAREKYIVNVNRVDAAFDVALQDVTFN